MKEKPKLSGETIVNLIILGFMVLWVAFLSVNLMQTTTKVENLTKEIKALEKGEPGNTRQESFPATIEVELEGPEESGDDKYADVIYNGETYRVRGDRIHDYASKHPGAIVYFDVTIRTITDMKPEIEFHGVSGGEIDYSVEEDY